MKNIYINAATQYNNEWDIKQLITDANMRRRMSTLVKMGVATGLKCLAQANVTTPDSIITATAYGCLADSEKFLAAALSSDEQNLPPTPFIQSTFNTIGSQLAILTHCNGYNMTFVNRQQSFTDALIDACLEIADGKHTVLLGYADEQTATLHNIIERMGKYGTALPQNNSAWFFLLSDQKTEQTIAEISNPTLNTLRNIGSVTTFMRNIMQ